MMRRILAGIGAALTLTVGIGIGHATAHPRTVTRERVIESVRPVPVPPSPGSVLTSEGRTVTPDDEGCFVLTYRELGAPDAGDPGDGEWYCAR